MTYQQLGKIWKVVGLLLLFYALNAWLVSQGGQEVFGAKLIAPGRVLAAVIAIPICTTLLIVTSLVGRLYAIRHGSTWHQRVPIFGFDSITTGSREGKFYQGTMFFAFSIFPWLALIHFWRRMLSATIISNDDTNTVIASVWDWSALKSLNNPASMCNAFDMAAARPCVDAFTLLPGLQPTAYAFLLLLAGTAAAMHWIALLR